LKFKGEINKETSPKEIVDPPTQQEKNKQEAHFDR
jgi:hypothetical protein